MHHRLWIWDIEPALLLLLLAGVAVAWRLSRRPRRGQRYLSLLIATALVALATLAFVVGIRQEPGPGSYEHQPAQVERSADLILTKVEVDHFHAPTHLELHWIAAGLCLSLLAIGPARIAVTPRRRSAVPAPPLSDT